MVNLKGRIALVTGAGRGIGKSIALMLAKNGVNLALTATSQDNLKLVKKETEQYNIDVRTYAADLSQSHVPSKLIEDVINDFGGIDILINNAGTADRKSFCETTVEDWDKHMNLNARAPFLLCKEAIPYLRKSEVPSIINIASVVGTKGYVNQMAYTASKHALMGMTKVLAQEVQEYGIRVHVISPGGVATEMVRKTRPDLNTDELIQPEEIADIVEFLLTHRGNAVIDEVSVHRASNTPWK